MTGDSAESVQRSALREALRVTSKGVKRAVGIPSKAEKAAASAQSSPANSGRSSRPAPAPPAPPAPPPKRSSTPPKPSSPKPLPQATPPAKSRSNSAPHAANSDLSSQGPSLGFSIGKALVCIVAVVACRVFLDAQPREASGKVPAKGKKSKESAPAKGPAFWNRKDWACSPSAKAPSLAPTPKNGEKLGLWKSKDWAYPPSAKAPVLASSAAKAGGKAEVPLPSFWDRKDWEISPSAKIPELSSAKKKKKAAGGAPPSLWERTDWACAPSPPLPPLASRDASK